MAENPTHPIPAELKQGRWFQFSVRTLVVAMVLVGVGLGIVANRARRQREAVSAISRVGGTVYYDYQKANEKRPNAFDPRKLPPGPEWLRRIIGPEFFQDVVMVNLKGKLVNDELFIELRKLRNLENLNLSDTTITDSQMAHLAHFHNLQYVALWNTDISDEGLAHLAHLHKMYALILDGTKVTDEGLKHLEELTNLEEWLGLCDTEVTDAGLQHFKRMRKLHILNVRRTKVTEDGVKELRRALPKVEISIGP